MIKAAFAAMVNAIVGLIRRRAAPYLECPYCKAAGELVKPCYGRCPDCGAEWEWVEYARNKWRRRIEKLPDGTGV